MKMEETSSTTTDSWSKKNVSVCKQGGWSDLFCGLFYDAVSSKTARLHGLIEVLSWHLPGENEKTHEKTSVRMGNVMPKI
jgi:hypothetical protein